MGKKKSVLKRIHDRLRLFVTSPKTSQDMRILRKFMGTCPDIVSGSLKYVKYINAQDEVVSNHLNCTVVFGIDMQISFQNDHYGLGVAKEPCGKLPSAWKAIANHLEKCYTPSLKFVQRIDNNNIVRYTAVLPNGKHLIIRPI